MFKPFVNFKSFGEKICILYTNWIFSPFVIPFQSFFSPTWYLAIFLVKQKNIHSCFPVILYVMKFCSTDFFGRTSPRWCSRGSPGGWIKIYSLMIRWLLYECWRYLTFWALKRKKKRKRVTEVSKNLWFCKLKNQLNNSRISNLTHLFNACFMKTVPLLKRVFRDR